MEDDSISYKEESFYEENKTKILISGALWGLVLIILCCQ